MKKRITCLLIAASVIVPCIPAYAANDWEALYADKIEEIRSEYDVGQRRLAYPDYENPDNLFFTLQDIDFDGVPELYHTQCRRFEGEYSTSPEYEEIYYIKNGAVVQGTIDTEYHLGLLPAYKERKAGDFTADRWQFAARNISTGQVSFITNDACNYGALDYPSRTFSELTFDKNSGILKSTALLRQESDSYKEPQYPEGYEYIGIGTYFSNTHYSSGNLWDWTAPYIAPEAQEPADDLPEDEPIKVELNGDIMSFDNNPIMLDGRILVPMRAIFEALGATVTWYKDSQEVIAKNDKLTVQLKMGRNIMYVNGKTIEIDVSPGIFGDTTYVPVRVVAEAFDAEVTWNGETKTVIIKTSETVADVSPTAAPIHDEKSSLLTLYVGSYAAYRNSEIRYIDADNHSVVPVIIDGSTLVPVRFITEAFDGKLDWDGKNGIAAITVGNNEVKIYIDKPYITVNGEKKNIDVPAQVIENRTMVPLRAFAEAIGKNVDYYNGLIVIGDEKSVNDIMSQDKDKYIADNFSGYIHVANKPELLKVFASDEYDVVVNTTATFQGREYHITSKNIGFSDHEYTINGTVMKTNGGFDTHEIYFADMNPDDDNIEILFTEQWENMIIYVTAFEYNGTSAYQIEPIIGGGKKNLSYDGITMNDDGSLSLGEQYRAATCGMWGLKKTYRLSGNKFVQDVQDYYEVNMRLLLNHWTSQNKTVDTKDEIYVRCDKSYAFLKKGDYFTILYDDENGNIYVRTLDGREDWIPIPKYQEGMKICEAVFWMGG
ncbi:MAG: copper amine oxidase N-terminal domain-containing protein [Oscillospiraceae bacterium]|nr:copper amine oxidase N-terminal domain-containing protein [Oscillospiraceae bacterium]